MNKKEILELKNKKLKSQIEYIKLKILEYKNKNQKPKSLINAEYTTKYFSNNKDESNSNTSELNELTKKIDYYSDEISKKKFQLDNILSINKITDLKNELKNENDKITSINDEKISLVKIYNNQVKAINDISMKFDIFNEKNDMDKINELKTIIKELEKKDKILDEKLKEQRVVYIDLNNTINKLKEKIKLIKSNKNINLSEIEKDKNYKVEIQLIQKEIADEQKLFNIEEENYKKIIYSNQNEIDRLNEEIQKRKEILEEKGKEYKKEKLNLMIKEKNKKINNKKNNKSYSNLNIITNDNFKNEEKKMDCYTKLYLYDEKYKQEKNKMAEKYYKSQNKSPTFCNYSEEIINKKAEKYYKKIFSLLDSDEDNKITAEHINIFAIPKKLQKILEPIFISLEEENESLNDIEFIYVCKQLYETLSWTDKREFMSFMEQEKNNYKKERANDFKNIYTFKPNINKRNNSYERLGTTMTDGKNYYYIVEKENINIDKSIKKNSNVRNNAEVKNKSISSKNCILINSGNNKNKIKTNDDHFQNNNLKGNMNYSLIRGKNKNVLINNNNQNALIKSINNTYKNDKLVNYFNVMSCKSKNQKKS